MYAEQARYFFSKLKWKINKVHVQKQIAIQRNQARSMNKINTGKQNKNINKINTGKQNKNINKINTDKQNKNINKINTGKQNKT